MCKRPTCKTEGCNTQPNFNIEGDTKALYCKNHKQIDMIDVTHKSCKTEGCKTRPNFNKEGEKKGLYCKNHKKVGMINIKDKTCKTEGCNTQPIFNIEGETKCLYCKDHKKVGMVNIKDKTCKTEGCKTQPSFNIEGATNGLYCKDHKLDGMIGVTHKTCKNDWCNTHVKNKKYEGYCLRCFMYTYPDKPIARNYKTKERAVADFILQYFPNFTWYCDKKIPDGCSKRRPDLFLDLGYIVIIIEIDENQHADYTTTCEEARINNISMDLNNRQVVMIRFNPDEYQDEEVKISSCWGTNKLGICVVKKNKIKEWKNRLNVLKENIEPFLNPDYNQDEPLKIINLFYDEN